MVSGPSVPPSQQFPNAVPPSTGAPSAPPSRPNTPQEGGGAPQSSQSVARVESNGVDQVQLSRTAVNNQNGDGFTPAPAVAEQPQGTPNAPPNGNQAQNAPTNDNSVAPNTQTTTAEPQSIEGQPPPAQNSQGSPGEAPLTVTSPNNLLSRGGSVDLFG